MRVRWARVAALALSGAAINFGVAYAVAAFVPMPSRFEICDIRDGGWRRSFPPGLPEPHTGAVSRNGAMTHWQIHHEGPSTTNVPPDYVINTYRVGFPCRSFETWYLYLAPGNTLGYGGPRQGWDAAIFRQERFMVTGRPYLSGMPLEPLWAGLAINSALYGGILWLCLGAAGLLRRAARRRRGRCEGCGYPVGVHAVCTECGRPMGLPGVPR